MVFTLSRETSILRLTITTRFAIVGLTCTLTQRVL
nr:MAG TPA: hypothetical protein [Caudoviricetes sp.]